MAKISPVSIKYIVHAKFEADGAIEKPDIIGAIFGQTEGLLGEDLEMRELQKTGKIGRIEVNTEYENSKTVGEIEVPSALDKTETAIIGAALETIERVGPSDTKITIESIEDVRGSKRDYILERAKKLMANLGDKENGIDEMTSEIKDSTRLAKLQTYGTENLPCGDISGDELIIVEGRADVINMLKNGIKNVISMNGSKLPETIISLTKEKPNVILFVDGDRGGNLIIKNVSENAKIDSIAMAPEGKEVEELTGKEILQALRKKVPVKDFTNNSRQRGYKRYDRDDKKDSIPKKAPNKTIKKMTSKEKQEIKDKVEELVGTKGAMIFNDKLEVIRKLPIGMLSNIRLNDNPYTIAIDGTATPRIVESCENLGCSNLIATNFVNTDTNINLVSM
ncbi:DNA primase [Candidatus Pacearchaeota archaeon]|nr:DNA primase [Candidatus Pacearchaeota archaeon]